MTFTNIFIFAKEKLSNAWNLTIVAEVNMQ